MNLLFIILRTKHNYLRFIIVVCTTIEFNSRVYKHLVWFDKKNNLKKTYKLYQ